MSNDPSVELFKEAVMHDLQPPREKDAWDKFAILGRIIGLVMFAVLIGYAGKVVESSVARDERTLRYIEVAVGILHTDPESKPSPGLREWAVNVIDQYSDVKLTEIARAELLDRPIPVAQPLPTNLTTSEVDALIRPYLGIGQWRPPNREPSALDGTPRESSSDLVKNLSLSLERDRHIAKLRAAGRLGRDDEATGLSLDELRKQAADLPDPPTDKP